MWLVLGDQYYGLLWMAPMMGIIGALLVTRWSLGLLRSPSAVLLDRQGTEEIREMIRSLWMKSSLCALGRKCR